MNRENPSQGKRSGIQIMIAPSRRATIHDAMLASANHAGRLGARCASRIATPAKPASSRIVRKARPMMSSASREPSSTHSTQTIAAAIRAPIATQMAARSSDEREPSAWAARSVVGAGVAYGSGAVMAFLS